MSLVHVSGDPKAFRFGADSGIVTTREALVEVARRVEQLGYSTLGVADHFRTPFAPSLLLLAAAQATSSMRLTHLVLNQDLRHPAVLAKELATLDVLSGGRLQIGIGAGWMQSEYEQAGLRFDTASVRIDRLEEVVSVLKGLFADEPLTFSGSYFRIAALDGLPKPMQRPRPPIMIGGSGRKLLSVAGRQADIVQVVAPTRLDEAARAPDAFSAEALVARIGWVQAAAGDRFGEIELGGLLAHVEVTNDVELARASFAKRISSRDPGTLEALLDSPMVAIGTLEDVCEKLRQVRAVFGLSYLTAPIGSNLLQLAPVIHRLAADDAMHAASDRC